MEPVNLPNPLPDLSEPIELTAMAAQTIKCAQCIGEFVNLPDDEKTDERWIQVNDAVTYLPCWQQTMLGPGQLVLACVSLPACLKHINVTEETPQQKAMRSGLALG